MTTCETDITEHIDILRRQITIEAHFNDWPGVEFKSTELGKTAVTGKSKAASHLSVDHLIILALSVSITSV